jgi:hypothetical protein
MLADVSNEVRVIVVVLLELFAAAHEVGDRPFCHIHPVADRGKSEAGLFPRKLSKRFTNGAMRALTKILDRLFEESSNQIDDGIKRRTNEDPLALSRWRAHRAW